MAATVTGISLEQYLATSYRPDVEFIDGHLQEKPMPTFLHGFMQLLIGSWFLNRIDEWNVLAAVEVRTWVETNRVRLPDVVVVVQGSVEMRSALSHPPLIAIEVLSPADTYSDLQDRAADLSAMGVRNIWLINPQRRTAEVWNGRTWQLCEKSRLTVVDGPVYLDMEWLWAKVDKHPEHRL